MTTGFILIRRVALEFDSYYWLSFEALKQCVFQWLCIARWEFILHSQCKGWVWVSLQTGLGICHPKLEIWNVHLWDAQPVMQATERPSRATSVFSQELQAGDGEWHSFSLHHQKLNFMIYAVGGGAGCQGRKWRGGEGRMMGFFDLGGHCIMLGTKKITAMSQWSFHITKHMLVRAFFFTFSPSFIKPHSGTSQLRSSKEGWEMTGRHFSFVRMFCFVFHHQAEDR